MKSFLAGCFVGAALLVGAVSFGPKFYDHLRPQLYAINSEGCLSDLKAKGVKFTQARDGRGVCRTPNAVTVRQLGATKIDKPLTMTCNLANDLADWSSANQLQKIWTMGVKSCRKNRKNNTLSEHAYGNAIDIHKLQYDGRVHTVSPRTPLSTLHRSACLHFGVALSPISDRLHHDHFHLDSGYYLGTGKVRCLLSLANR